MFLWFGSNALPVQFEKQHRENTLLTYSPSSHSPSHGFGNESFPFCITCFMCVLKSTQGTQVWFLPARCCVKILEEYFQGHLRRSTIHIHLFTDKNIVSAFSLTLWISWAGLRISGCCFQHYSLVPQKLTGAEWLVFAFALTAESPLEARS